MRPLGRAEARPSRKNLRLGMAGVMNFHALRQQTLATPLAPARKSGASAFRAHPGAKTVLVFPGPLRALECSFHDVKSGYVRGVSRSVNRSPAIFLSSSSSCSYSYSYSFWFEQEQEQE
jgi:hypothetical protein